MAQKPDFGGGYNEALFAQKLQTLAREGKVRTADLETALHTAFTLEPAGEPTLEETEQTHRLFAKLMSPFLKEYAEGMGLEVIP